MAELEKKRAWVVPVFLGDNYVAGALVVAQSLAEVATRFETICMVTLDVSPDARDALRKVFTRVVQVPYIIKTDMPDLPTIKLRKLYGSWISHSYTRWNVLDPLQFGEYEKLCLLDADLVFVENCDHLFDLPTPAATASSPWARPYCETGMQNYFLHEDGTELAHGEAVDMSALAMARQKSFICRTSVALVKPEREVFGELMRILTQPGAFAVHRCLNGYDEAVFADTFLNLGRQMYNIHQQYNWTIGKDAWLVNGEQPSVYAWYGVEKPWDLDPSAWPDLRVWQNIAENVVFLHPSTKPFFARKSK